MRVGGTIESVWKDTSIGGGGGEFPSTRWSQLQRLSGVESDAWRRSFEELATIYWRPVYRYIRLRWRLSNEEAKDRTQEFFVEMMEGALLARAADVDGRFRVYLKVCLENFLRRQHRDARRQKRGGGRVHLRIDGPVDEAPVPVASDQSPEEVLDREWRVAVMDEAVRRMLARYEDEGRSDHVAIFRRCKMHDGPDRPPTRAEVAAGLGLTEGDVKNALEHSRRRLSETLREVVSDSVSTPEALRREMEELF